MSVMTSWHPRSEAITGGILLAGSSANNWLDQFVNMANNYVTPLCSMVAAVCGAVFGLHGVYRWAQGKRVPRP